MIIYTYVPSRRNEGYDIIALGGYKPLETVSTRFKAEQNVKTRNLERGKPKPIAVPKKKRVVIGKRRNEHYDVNKVLQAKHGLKYVVYGQRRKYMMQRSAEMQCSMNCLYSWFSGL